MMNREQIEAPSAMERCPSIVKSVGSTQGGKLLFELSEDKAKLMYQPPESEVFAKALRSAAVDELDDCLRQCSGRLRECHSEIKKERVRRILQEFKRRGEYVPPHNIAVEEAVRLARYCRFFEARLALDITQAYLTNYPNMRGFEYGACFHAGMIEGVRQERVRRRRRWRDKEA